VGRRLSELLGEGSIISRSNIHQFAILVEHNRGEIDTQEITHRIRDRFLSPIHIDKSKIYLNISIGITHSQFGYDRMEDVLRDAETAVSHAAALGGGQDQTFDQWLYEVSDLHHL
jgi:GGDEF domain-containing protein